MRSSHLYVHVPFCARRCVYCDFSIAVRQSVPIDEYVAAVDRELATRHRDSSLILETLYLGGGTPSKLGADGVTRLIERIQRHAELRPDAEITLEANPEDVSTAAARAWRRAGVNRVSLGVQSFDDGVLAWMHRTHDAAKALTALETLREVGIDNLSIDLIFALPRSVPRSWERDLEISLALRLPHVSVYGLTVEPHTPLGRWVARRDVSEAPEESFEREFLRAHDQLAGAGFDHYEVSNYGTPGRHSRHNWAYWNRRPYAGVGPSAHEFDGSVRRWNSAAYVAWESRLSEDQDPLGGREELSAEHATAEMVYLSLRTNAGLAISAAERDHVVSWIAAGWAVCTSDSVLRLSSLGWLRLDALAIDLTLFRSRYYLGTYESRRPAFQARTPRSGSRHSNVRSDR